MKKGDWAFVLILFFSVFGFIIFSYLVHEFSHYWDFKEVTDEGRICLRVTNFTLTGDGAVYLFFPKEGTEKEVESIKRHTEIRAYGIASLFLVLFSICFWSVIGKWFWSEE
jgi:hypothetical protein